MLAVEATMLDTAQRFHISQQDVNSQGTFLFLFKISEFNFINVTAPDQSNFSTSNLGIIPVRREMFFKECAMITKPFFLIPIFFSN